MQPLPGEAEPRRQRRVGAVHGVAGARMPLRRHVHADLVRAPGLEVHLEQRRVRERLERLVVGHRVLAVGDHRELPLRARMPPDRRVDRAGERVGMALHDGVVDLLDLAVVELRA